VAGQRADVAALEEVVELERRLLDPEVRARPGAVERLLHPDFREVGASGRTWDRAEIVAALRDDPGTGAAMEEVRPTRLAEDVVLLTYTAVPPAGPRSLRSSVWVASEDGWRVRFHQGTRSSLSGS
jgi:ribonuclease HI